MSASKKHTNLLVNSTSPYLLQHAHNPVDWYPWSQEALDMAKEQNKPILLSVGYSACHWCHVMEKESFENEDTAKLMNEFYVNIKVDRVTPGGPFGAEYEVTFDGSEQNLIRYAKEHLGFDDKPGTFQQLKKHLAMEETDIEEISNKLKLKVLGRKIAK